MIRFRRISAIYRKEILDVLRDQRTLVAMVVVPLVLYPVLILGSLQAVKIQTDTLTTEPIVIAVGSRQEAEVLDWTIAEDARIQEREAAARPGAQVNSLTDSRIKIVTDVRLAVAEGAAEVGVRLLADDQDQLDLRAGFELIVDDAEIRSQMAGRRLENLFERVSRRYQHETLERIGQPESLLDPIPILRVNVAAPEKIGGSILSQIVPLVLVLMAVTGAIYPAIDLTAGERERGTLETLMACPVPVEEIVVGKFLVITTISLIAASLNLFSIGLTLQATGMQRLLTSAEVAAVPFAVLPLILIAMIPFAVLFSAVLIAVASFAKSFKEAQNYMVPVILAALIPGMAAALPGTRLEGGWAVMPVANMVLLTRELLLGHFENLWGILLVLASTTLYAATAVIVAARLFGQEAVLFADAPSFRTLFRRALFNRQARPTAAQGLLMATILFPVWFHLQPSLARDLAENPAGALGRIQIAMILTLAGIPLLFSLYRKIDLRGAFALRKTSPRYFVAAILMGCSGWVLAHEIVVLQGVPAGLAEQFGELQSAIDAMPIAVALLALAVIPACSEEFLFRGFILSGLRSWRCFPAVLVVGLVFGMYHFLVIRFALTALLGMALAYLCWQSRSIWPCVLMHMLHNGVSLSIARYADEIGLNDRKGAEHLPLSWILIAAAVFLAGIWLSRIACADKPVTPKITSDPEPAALSP